MSELPRAEPSRSPLRLLIVAAAATVLFIVFFNFLRLFIGPMVLAFIVSYLANPIFGRIEQRGIPRPAAVAAAIILSTIVGSTAAYLLVPLLVEQFEIFFRILPRAIDNVNATWLPKLQVFVTETFGSAAAGIKIANLGDLLVSKSFSLDQVVISGLGAGTQLIGMASLFILATPTFCYFLMKDFPRLTEFLSSLIPVDLRPSVHAFAADVDYTVRSVLSGQILVIGLLSILYSTAFFFAGLPGGVAIGIITGLARIIPYLDVLLGASLSIIVLVTNGSPFEVMIGVMMSFIAIQLIDGIFLTPRIVGQFAGLHPVIIIIAVLTFGDRFGFYGVLFAIPITAVARVVLANIIRAYRNSRFYLALP